MCDTMDEPAQSTTRPTVTVQGQAVLRASPDEALLSITIDAVDAAAGAALADVAARTQQLVAILDSLKIAASDRVTARVSVEEEFEHTQEGRHSLGHRASARTTVRLTDQQLVGPLIERATGELAAHVEGPHWRIALDNPIRLEAARAAASAGRRRAEAYASGLNARIGALLALVETDAEIPPGVPVFRAAARMKRMAMPIEAGEHEVAASVFVTFALEPADG